MAKVTSNSTVHVTVIGADGEPRTLKASATENISFDSKHRHNEALLTAGAITLDGREPASSDSRSSARNSGSRRGSPKASVPSTPKAAAPTNGNSPNGA